MRLLLLAGIICCWNIWCLKAEITMPGIFSDNMVLQRDMPIKFWGRGKPGVKVSVKIGEQSESSVTDANGKWNLVFPELKAGGPYKIEVKSSEQTIVFRNVLIGDIWLCAGQSNMEWQLKRAFNSKQEIDAAKFPRIRLFKVKRQTSDSPLYLIRGKWKHCSPSTAASFSAVAYFFGRKLHNELNIPIGIIDSSWGGSPIRAWTAKSTIDSSPGFKNFKKWWAQTLKVYKNASKNIDEYKIALKEWQNKQKGKRPLPPIPDYKKPSYLFNGMIFPLIPYGIKGVAWYQGEADTGRAEYYHDEFRAMISGWRSYWQQGCFPFLFVQLANFGKRENSATKCYWAVLREGQRKILEDTPKTGMAVAIDIGEAQNVHPLNKQDVGLRLALNALKLAYNRKGIVFSGPTVDKMTIKKNVIVLTFDNIGSGLVLKKPSLNSFEIAGKNRAFKKANVKLDGNKVLIWNKNIKTPVAVRYAWAKNPYSSLYNKEGLPASPFKTVNWKD